jgi:ribosomal protein S20
MEWQIEQWVAYREDEKKEISTNEANRRWNNSVDSFKTTYSKVYTDELAAKAREAYEASYEKYGDETKAHAAAQEIFKNA